jgi:pimeloyl-ACP methyl ester carboxylesterase
MGVKGATAERVDAEVFDGNFMLYRAGVRGAEPVVLVHGLGPNGARDWGTVIPALATRYDVFALDLPGFGASDKGNQLYSPDNYAQLLEKVIAPRVGKPFNLVGHSMGGAIALGFAGTRPERVRRLVLVGMAGVLQGPVYAESLAKFGIGEVTGMPGTPWLDEMVGRMIERVEKMPLSREAVLRTPALRQQLLRGDPSVIAAFALGEHDFSAALRAVRAPTLLIWGSTDQIAPLRTAQLARAVIPGARLEVIVNAGHTPQADDPDRFNELLLEHLRDARQPTTAAAKGGPLAQRVEKCDGKAGARFNGDFQKLTLIRCSGVQVHNARIGELRVLESDVALVNSEVLGGLYALRSRIEMTAGVLAGPVRLEETGLDAAGTRFEGDAVVDNVGTLPVTLRLSVAEVRPADGKSRYVHESVRLAPGKSW